MTLPITERPTWAIRDSSKLDDYLNCPRKYFFRHILGWNLDMPAHDLWFGQCWHIAREYQLLNGYDDIAGAYTAFITEYVKNFDPRQSEELYKPKTPTAVMVALTNFAQQRPRDLVENEVVEIAGTKMTEISGTVPVDEKRFLHYRMDSIMRRKEDGKIFSWDHKTTNGKYINNRQWADQFFLGIQNGTYTHCLYCLFPYQDVLGIEFCGTGFEFLSRGSANRPAGFHTTFRRIPAYKTLDQMNVWIWTVNNILDRIEDDMEELSHCSEDDQVMMCFPMNPSSCTDYRGCQFHDFCCSWSNPLQRCNEPPLGFREEFWDPSAMQTTNKLNLTYEGLK